MSYNRSYNYSSPLGGYSGSHSSSNYSSPSGRYSSTSSYDSSSRRYDSGLGSGGYGSGLSGGGYGSGLGSGGYGSSKYGSGSLSSLSGSSYSPRYSGSSYSPSSSSYSSGRYDSTSRGSGYTPRSDYSSSRYSRPVSSYDDYGSSTRNRSSDTSSSSRHRSAIDDDDIPVKANRKIKFDDEVETTPTRSKRSTDSSSLTTKTSGDSSASEARRKRREEKEATDDKGGSPIPTRSADVDVSNVTRKTENLTIDNPAPTSKPTPKSGSPSRGTTSLPHGDGVATKGTSAMNQQSANPDKIPVCGKCDKEIRGPFVLALNKSWCPSCFTCDQCGSELVNMGFVELNGKIYCENDYETFFAPKCAKCRLPIIGDTVNALDKTWHPACFVCAECGCAISSGAFHVEDGLPYCMKDWQRLFQTKCTGCTYPVEPGDKWIEALDANWHSECFVCGVCQLKLEGQPFYPKDGKPFCKAHAAA